jgi:hypothetical protein
MTHYYLVWGYYSEMSAMRFTSSHLMSLISNQENVTDLYSTVKDLGANKEWKMDFIP